MQLLIDSIHEFYNDAENLAAFEEWKERKKQNESTQIKSSGKES